ncbi:MAG: hypothetical protein Kow00109_07710 [Acidobacteriota bacterium]
MTFRRFFLATLVPPLIGSWLLLSGGTTLAQTGASKGDQQPVYLDPRYSFEERAADLVSRMTPEEKQSQLGNSMAAIPRLGVNAYNVWGEALHGVLSFFITGRQAPQPTTSFPNSVALGASWDPELVERITRAISDEARGLNHEAIRNLTFWSPVVEPMRDPRWGRNGESYGEDPFLISRIAAAFVRGMMGDDPKYLKTAPTGKHYLANNSEFNRHTGNSELDERDLWEYYIVPYRELIRQERLPAIMSCYNRVNGEPVTGSRYFIDTIARKTFGLDGYVTGDCGAVEDIFAGHKYRANRFEATALALKAGVDTDCGNIYQRSALQALQQGLIDEADIDRALLHMFTLRMRFGEFDPPEQVPYRRIGPEVITSEEHAALAAEAATKTIVLLKNDPGPGSGQPVLPLAASQIRKLAVLGPQADRVELGPYSGLTREDQRISPLAGIRRWLEAHGARTEVVHAEGASATPQWNIFNLSWFEVVKTDGTRRRYPAADFAETSPGVQLAGSGNDRRLRSLDDGSWVSYRGIDWSGAATSDLRLSVPGDGGTIELRAGSPEGRLLASVDVEGGGGVFRGRTATMELAASDLSADEPVYFVFHGKPLPPISEETLELARSADVAVVFVGTDDRTAGEEGDRQFLALPGNQLELIKQVASVNPRTIVVLQTLGMVEVEDFRHLENVRGILWYGFNGQAQGEGIARILFGEAAPGGKLNFTWYKSSRDLPEFTDYRLRGDGGRPGRTYWYYTGDVSYEFGYGLSYTTFEYANVRADKTRMSPEETVTIRVDVRNRGEVTADEVVQVYVRTPDSPAALERPQKRLRGFRRVTIPAGQTRTVEIPIRGTDLAFWDPETDQPTYDPGRYVFEVGASSRDIRGRVEVELAGSPEPVLEVATLECEAVVVHPGERITCGATGALSNLRLLDPAETVVRFRTNRPEVATVDASGVVTAHGPGVATITAEVTYGGRTLTDTWPVKVQPDLALAELKVAGRRPAEFAPERRGYSFLVPAGAAVPAVEAQARDPQVQVTVEAAERVPGTTVITVVDPRTGQSERYVVAFGTAGVSDDFKGATLGGHWRRLRENAADWKLDPVRDRLVLTARPGDLKEAANNAANVLLQPANGDWVIEAKLSFSREPAVVDQQGGILAYQDDDNYVKLVYGRATHGFAGMGNYFELVVEREGHQYLAANLEADALFECDRTIVFRLEKDGTVYRAYYSKDGIHFSPLGATDVVLRDVQVGILAVDGDPSTRGFSPLGALIGQGPGREEPEPFVVAVDYFNIEDRSAK